MSDRVLCIDPGTTHSGAVLLDTSQSPPDVLEVWPRAENGEIRWAVQTAKLNGYEVAIEMIASYGMAVGAETFETVLWIGRFLELRGEDHTHLVYRREVKSFLCGSMRAKDANVRQAILDLYPSTGGGKIGQKGTKMLPGPLYGVSKHAWQALAVGLTWALDEERGKT